MGIHLTEQQAKELGIVVPPKAGKRHVKAEMNKWESQFASTLETRRIWGEIDSWQFESVKLKLADKTYYTPDFAVWHNDGTLELIEVKGFWRDDARVKIKVAAAMFRRIKFTAAFGLKKGQWRYEYWNHLRNPVKGPS